MLPKYSRHFIQPTKEACDIDSELVEDLVDFYYKTVFTKLSKLEIDRLSLEGLGTFEIKKPSLLKELGKCKARLETCNKNTRVHIEYRKDLTEQIDKLTKLKDKVTNDFKKLLEWEKLKASRKSNI